MTARPIVSATGGDDVSGFDVDTEQIRQHALHIDGLRARFGAVKAASAHITRNDAAYGLLCGWISGVLEGRHGRQDELIAHLEKNLSLVSEALRRTADNYDDSDTESDNNLRALARRLAGAAR